MRAAILLSEAQERKRQAIAAVNDALTELLVAERGVIEAETAARYDRQTRRWASDGWTSDTKFDLVNEARQAHGEVPHDSITARGGGGS